MSYWHCHKCGSHSTVTAGGPEWAVFRSWDANVPVRCIDCSHRFEVELTATGQHDVEFEVENHE